MLTNAQIEARRGKLTASRVACLMTQNRVEIDRLYRELIGEAEPENLDHVWPVLLGSHTEAAQLIWYERKGGVLSREGRVVVHPKYPLFAATLDAWDDILGCPIECKHTGGREPLEIIVERYSPQLHWQMECTGASQCVLSLIMGNSEPILEYIKRDEEYIREMINRGLQFMEHVRLRTPPVALDPVPPPADATKIYDMTGNNEWGSSAFVWHETRGDFNRCRDAEKILKSLVPADAKKCSGHSVVITRDRAGRLSLREDQEAIFRRTGALT